MSGWVTAIVIVMVSGKTNFILRDTSMNIVYLSVCVCYYGIRLGEESCCCVVAMWFNVLYTC